MEDKTLKCCDCDGSFVFSAAEQQFYSEKKLTNMPKRCHSCLVLARLKRSGKDVATATDVTCALCGNITRVPFKPQGHKPVYCASCFRAAKQA